MSRVQELVDAFATAPPQRRSVTFHALTGALWQDGTLTGAAVPAVPVILRRLPELSDDRRDHLLILLGLLASAEYPAHGGPATSAARAGLDHYLDLLRGRAGDEPLTLALLYLLGHFPADRRRILAVASETGLAPEDRTRLERSLSELDPDAPELGRVWPAPSVWVLDEAERRFDRAFIGRLTPAQVVTNWENDTRTVRGYLGAQAYWAVRHGTPVPVPPAPPPAVADQAGGSAADALRRHAAVLRCPDCHAALEVQETTARCTGCAIGYPIVDGILGLTSGVRAGETDEATASLLRQLAEMPSMGTYYESVLRPAFLRVSGSNWGGAVTPANEDEYLTSHVRPVDGPVLDLAAGAGRWTQVLAAATGLERVIALDMAVPMLTVLRRRLPAVPAVQASALTLPFADASLGAVNCWNALQAFPDHADVVLREIGRCLKPGGTLTMMTFVWDPDPVYRYFQASHYFPGRAAGMVLFEAERIRDWLAAAGLTVRAESGPETFMFVTAQRTGETEPGLAPAGSGSGSR